MAALRAPTGFGESMAELVRVHRDSGGTVQLEVTGAPRSLPEQADQAARRVVQELLTNARKHAPDQPVDLEVSWSTGSLTISATNPLGPERGYAGGLGQGLRGIGERCRALGGRLSAGRTPDDEFTVTCSLPLEA
ncbi:hypothetical protein CGZ93_05040 [Enemella dayhoffiae]|uniref:histidine kinase n=1 Tax=Enemella dayhoffiae TaxID=2016507 RepID=A0A255H9I3_9ACTN|nr:ATP-binding protein [Enemella dayhoffiae]OYO23886.1 hypothetical protein CGZ93_05040 [Enemella dayhoffiae]